MPKIDFLFTNGQKTRILGHLGLFWSHAFTQNGVKTSSFVEFVARRGAKLEFWRCFFGKCAFRASVVAFLPFCTCFYMFRPPFFQDCRFPPFPRVGPQWAEKRPGGPEKRRKGQKCNSFAKLKFWAPDLGLTLRTLAPIFGRSFGKLAPSRNGLKKRARSLGRKRRFSAMASEMCPK